MTSERVLSEHRTFWAASRMAGHLVRLRDTGHTPKVLKPWVLGGLLQLGPSWDVKVRHAGRFKFEVVGFRV